MTPEQFEQLLAIIQQRAAKRAAENPYFIFVYDWGIVNPSDKIVTAAEINCCVSLLRFPPIGKN